MFPVSFTRVFKIARRASVVKSFLSKITEEICTFYSSIESSIMCITMFRKVPLLQNLQKSTDCNVTKNELLTKLFKSVLKIIENLSRKSSSVMEFYFSELQAYKLNPSGLRVFKILDNSWDNVCWGVRFLQKQALSDYMQNNYSKQLFGKLSGSPASIFKRTPP